MTVLANGPQSTLDDEARYAPISDAERDAFARDGFLLVPGAVNTSPLTRKVVFIGYAHRWIRPLDEVDYRRDPEWFDRLSPVRRQLLGAGADNASFWGVRQDGWIDMTIPVRAELAGRDLLDSSQPYLR